MSNSWPPAASAAAAACHGCSRFFSLKSSWLQVTVVRIFQRENNNPENTEWDHPRKETDIKMEPI